MSLYRSVLPIKTPASGCSCSTATQRTTRSKVVETLLALTEHPGEVIPKAELLRIWPEGYVDEANLAQNVVLRKAAALAGTSKRSRRSREEATALSLRHAPRVCRSVRSRAGQATARAPTRNAPASPRPWHWHCSGPRRYPPFHQRREPRIVPPRTARLYTIRRYYLERTPDGIAKSIQYYSRIVANDPRDASGCMRWSRVSKRDRGRSQV